MRKRSLLAVLPAVILVGTSIGCNNEPEPERVSSQEPASSSVVSTPSSTSKPRPNSSSSKPSTPSLNDDPREYFLWARDRTVNGAGFSYDDELDITTTIDAPVVGLIDGPTAHRVGETQYSTTGDVGFYQHFTSSGALLVDGQKFYIREGTTLKEYTENEDGELTGYDEKEVESDYKYDTSTFAKAIFEYADSDIDAVTHVSGNKYEIDCGFTFSNIVSTTLKVLDNAFVQNLLEQVLEITVPDTANFLHFYVTFTPDGYIDTYEYDFKVAVEVASRPQTLEFDYTLDFDSYKAQDIQVPEFPGTITTATSIQNALKDINGVGDAYRKLKNSSYDFELNTSIDYGSWWEIGGSPTVDVKGSTKREVKEGTVYFLNDLDVNLSGAYKDVWDDAGDYERVRGRTSDGKVWDVEDKLIFSDVVTEVTSDVSLEEFYLLPGDDFFVKDNVTAGEREEDDEKTTISFGLSAEGVKAFMKFVDDTVRTDPDVNGTNEFSIWGEDYEVSGTDESSLSFVYEGNNLVSVEIEIAGNIDTEIGDDSGLTTFEASMSIEVTEEGNGYTAPSDAKDLVDNI